MTLHETLQALSVAARSFRNGTAITPANVEGAGEHCRAFIDLVRMAQRKGATPYEIVRAYKGEVLGDSW